MKAVWMGMIAASALLMVVPRKRTQIWRKPTAAPIVTQLIKNWSDPR